MIRLVCAAAMLLVIAGMIGCGREDHTAQPTGPAEVRLQLNWRPEAQFGGFYHAKQTDIYTWHGLDVEIVPGGVGTPTVQMVAAGKVQFGIASADEIVLARSNGADVVGLFAVFQTCPQALMTHASREFRNISEIFQVDGTLAIQRGLPYADFLERLFGFGRLRVVPSPGGDLSAFREDQNYTMQCFFTSEPIAARRLGLDPQTFLIAEAGYNPYTTVLITRGDYLKSHPQVVRSMVNAVREGWQGYLHNPVPANSAMHKLNPTMDELTFAESTELQRPLIENVETQRYGLGVMTIDRWRLLARQLENLRLLSDHVDPASCFVDFSQR